MALTQATKTELYRFFAIAFDAAPGVTYMSQLAEASEYGMSVQEIVEVFTTKPQFTSIYPNFFTNAQFATKLVENVVGSSASDAAKAEAVADIVGALNAGWSQGQVIYQVFTNLANKSFDDPVWGGTAKQMANQVIVAQYYTEEMLGNTTDLVLLQSVIAGVTADTDVSSAAAIENAIGFLTGEPIVLTTGQDNLTGTSGNDLFVGLVDGAASTFTLGDIINGGAGNDTLRLSTSAESMELGLATINSVENLVADIRNSGFDTLDLAGTSFANVTLEFGGRTHADSVDVDNVADNTAVTISNVNFDGYGVEINHNGTSALNSSLTLNNVRDAEVDVYANQSAAGGAYTLTLNGVEDVDFYIQQALNLNVVVNAAATGIEIMNYSGFDADDAVVNLTLNADLQVDWWDLPDDSDSNTTFNIVGSGNLTIADFDDGSSATTINGAAATGNIDITDGGGSIVSVTTGSGNDRIVLDGDYFVADSELVVALGAGTDTLAISGVSNDTDMNALDFTDVTISGVEALEFTDSILLADDTTLDLTAVGAGLQKLVFADLDGGGFELAVEGAASDFAIESAGSFETFLAIDGVTDLSITAGDAIWLEDLDAADLVNLTLDAAGGADAYLGWEAGYDLGKLETLTVTGADAADDSYHYVEVYSGASALTTVSISGNWSGLYVEAADALETVTLAGGSDYWGDDAWLEVVGAESLATATLSGVEAYVYLENTPALSTVDITGISDYAWLDLSLADADGTVSILIGGSDVEYWADTVGGMREVFSFLGDDIGTITITDFLAGVGSNGDRLDFSGFAGVDSLEDLVIVYDGSDTTITSAGFEGTITVVGVDVSDDAYNYIF